MLSVVVAAWMFVLSWHVAWQLAVSIVASSLTCAVFCVFVFPFSRVTLLRELGAHQPFAFQISGLTPESRYFVSFEVSKNTHLVLARPLLVVTRGC